MGRIFEHSPQAMPSSVVPSEFTPAEIDGEPPYDGPPGSGFSYMVATSSESEAGDDGDVPFFESPAPDTPIGLPRTPVGTPPRTPEPPPPQTPPDMVAAPPTDITELTPGFSSSLLDGPRVDMTQYLDQVETLIITSWDLPEIDEEQRNRALELRDAAQRMLWLLDRVLR